MVRRHGTSHPRRGHGGGPAYLLRYSIAAARESYSAATGREVLYNSNLIRDRKSRSLAGTLNPDAALERLLDGTGLSPRYLADRSPRTVNFPIVAPSRHGGIPESDVSNTR
jgi:hypothetical protein